jgi:PAS domain S-box-containing protein
MRNRRMIVLFVVSFAAATTFAFAQVIVGADNRSLNVRQVLILHSFDAPFDEFARNFRIELARQSPVAIDFFDAWVPAGRLSRDPEQQSVVDDLRSKYSDHKLDLIVAMNGPAVLFAQTYRQQLFPATPMLLAGTDRRFVHDATLTTNDTAIPIPFNPVGTVEQILQLRPQTTHIFVVLGAAPLEQFWRSELDRELQRFNGRLTLVWSDNQTFQDLLKRAATLPANSAIFYVRWSVDRNGLQTTQDRVLIELHAAADAPIFDTVGYQVGQGVVGGLVGSGEGVSRNVATVAVRILRGESLRGVVPQALVPEYDWRELQRWNISENLLPPGSIVRFRERTMWDRYRWPILAFTLVSLSEAVLILGLIVNRAKRRRAERSVRESEERFRLLANNAPVMIWVADCNNLCTYANDAWLQFAGRTMEEELGGGWAEGVHPDDLDRCRTTYTKAFDRRERFRMEHRHRRHDGEFRSLLVVGVPRFTPGRAFSGYIGSAIDVTEQKVAEDVLSGLSHKLMRAQEDERAFVARELHDDISQQLAMLTMDLDLVGYARHDGERAERLSSAIERAHGLATSVHQLSHRLHPVHLQILGLIPAIQSLQRDLSRPQRQIVFSHRDVPTDIEPEIVLCVFRVAQEALTNAVKHSDAAHVWVSLTGESTELALTISDDGAGFDVEGVFTHGLGLTSIRERLRAVGGALEIYSMPGSGTVLRATVPVPMPSTRALGATLSA